MVDILADFKSVPSTVSSDPFCTIGDSATILHNGAATTKVEY